MWSHVGTRGERCLASDRRIRPKLFCAYKKEAQSRESLPNVSITGRDGQLALTNSKIFKRGLPYHSTVLVRSWKKRVSSFLPVQVSRKTRGFTALTKQLTLQ